ncbi:MAG: efflux RND transporter periplasmic adaptor subunit [Planctomycetota bacterium]|nr:efflux RND transporter periplasmic adaptor subunit [Planctomycetota bacterium]
MADSPDLSRLKINRTGDSSEPTRSGKSIGLFVISLGLIVLLMGWWNNNSDLSSENVLVVQTSRAGKPRASSPATGVSANGYVVARRQAALSTDIQGRVVELPVEEGAHVAKGDLVARLDTRQLETGLAQARADLEQAKATLSLAMLEFSRRETLLVTGDINQEAMDRATADKVRAQATVDSQQSRVDEIEVMIDKSSVYAPFSGVITAKNAEIGEVVSSLAGAGPDSRAAVVTLVDFESLEVQVELAQTSLSAATVGGLVDIYLDAWPTEKIEGKVRQIWPTANRQKATVELRVVFLQQNPRALPEMGVRVVFREDLEDIPTEIDPSWVWVPNSSIISRDGEPAVFLYQSGKAVRQPVTLGGEPTSGSSPISEGLTEGDMVILHPPVDLQDGQSVALDKSS